MSFLSYGGISLGQIRTLTVSQNPKADDSGIDYLWHTFTVEVESIFTVRDDLTTQPLVAGAIAVQIDDLIAELRHHLETPRQELIFRVGEIPNRNMFLVNAANDANWGPKPGKLTIRKITPVTLHVIHSYEFALADCVNKRMDLASNRWSQSHTIDASGFVTIATDGVLWVRSDMRKNPDALRAAVIPPILPDFHREETRFHVQKDGLALHYSIRDVQKYLLPPAGCVKGSGTRSITQVPNSEVFWAQVDLQLEGRRQMAKRDLLDTATKIGMQALEALGVQRDDNNRAPIISGSSWSEELWENKVGISLRGMIKACRDVKAPGGFVEVGEDALAELIKLGGNFVVGPVLGAIGGAQIDQNREQMKEAIRKARDLDRQLAERDINTTLAKPPHERVGAPLQGVDFGRPGLEFGIRGDEPLAIVLQELFFQPCGGDVIKLKRPNDDEGARLNKHLVPLVDENALGGAKIKTVDDMKDSPQNDIDQAVQELDEASLRSATFNPSLTENSLRTFDFVDDIERFVVKDVGLMGWSDINRGMYETWIVKLTQTAETNTIVQATTKEGEPARVFRLANPLVEVNLTYHTIKYGDRPEIPMICDPNLIPVGRPTLVVNELEVAADGVTKVYEASGSATYKALDYTKVVIRWPIPPWMRQDEEILNPAPLPRLIDLDINAPKTNKYNQRRFGTPPSAQVNA